MLKTLAERRVPALLPREEMLEILQREEYGYMPKKPDTLTFTVKENIVSNFCAGKAPLNKVTASGTIDGREFAFPFYTVIPKKPGKHPFFIHINFRDAVPDRYMPTEELVDNGYAVLSFCYTDVTSDDNDFTNGLAGTLYPDGTRGETDAGKISLWAWAAHRVMDYAETLADVLDLSHNIVCGHSRLGKTAIWTAATDERFGIGYSNDSGCSGAAITRGKIGESAERIYKVFPFWFCANYAKYSANEDAMPFDQHYVLAAIAPRPVCVGSASEDSWADPASEQLACAAASPAYEAMGFPGFIAPDRFAEIGEAFFEGNIGYHLREGLHYFSRTDWLQLMKFADKRWK